MPAKLTHALCSSCLSEGREVPARASIRLKPGLIVPACMRCWLEHFQITAKEKIQ